MKYKGCTISIEQDELAESPHKWDNLGVMACFHSRYNLGDKVDLAPDHFNGWTEMAEYIKTELGAVVILPLYLCDHGGITIATGPFSCQWDSGQVGFIYVTHEKLIAEYGNVGPDVIALAGKVLQAEVETYDQYLTGDVWGFTAENEDGHNIGSCWGYYGQETAIEEAKGAVDYYITNKKNWLSDIVVMA